MEETVLAIEDAIESRAVHDFVEEVVFVVILVRWVWVKRYAFGVKDVGVNWVFVASFVANVLVGWASSFGVGYGFGCGEGLGSVFGGGFDGEVLGFGR